MDTASPKGPHPVLDGQLHRANALGKKNKKNMHVWYVLHSADRPGEVPAGAFGDLALGIEDTWCAKKPSSLTDEERRALKDRMKEAAAARAKAQAELHKAAAAAAGLIMKATGKADPSHPYLAKKGLPVFAGLRVLKSNVRYTIDPEEEPKTARAGNLVVPMFNPAGELVGAQIIQSDGTKRFIKGTAKEGNYHSIGKAPEDGNGVILVAEGYATAARLHAATGYLTIAAFDAGNLNPVGKAIRKKYPAARIVFAADNDRFTKVGDAENPGVTKAKEAADQVKGRVAIPQFEDGDITRTDFDDLAQQFGLERVRADIEAVLYPAQNEISRSGTKARRKSAPIPSFEELGLQPRVQKKQIKIVAGAIDKAVDAAIAVLSDPQVGVFARGEELVRVVTVKTPSRTLSVRKEVENIRREEGSVILTSLSPDAIVDVLTAHADFVKYDRRAEDWLPTNCPIEVARTVMARKGHGWTMPRLRAIISAPTMRHDGTVIASPGYDVGSGLLLTGDDLWRNIPETPSKRDALDALDVLVEPLRDFPFVANSDRAASAALLITAVLRPTLRHAPMFAITAPAAGTGKSKLIDIAAIMATGRKAAVITPTPDEAELEKRIGASAIEGDQVMAIDNITHVLKSDQLCQMLTAEEVKVRVLGQSKAPRIPSTALICATGNNISIHGDLNRRTVLVRMDAGCERPEEREFPVDAVDVAKRRRADLVAAALTIIRAFLVAGAPRQCTPLGGFEDWSAIVRSALIWLDYGDCLGDVAAMRGEDPEKQQLVEILDALPSWPFTAKEIGRLVGQDPDLRDALSQYIERTGTFATKRFGRYLTRYKGTIVGNLRVEAVASSTAGTTWQVKRGE
jgi:putative DNA primase/helicase